MMLWDIIRDFFVKYIFGGLTSTFESYSGFLGEGIVNLVGEEYASSLGTSYVYPVIGNGQNIYTDEMAFVKGLSLGDYLSTTATIIVMVLFCFLLVKLVIWIFKLGANLIRLR